MVNATELKKQILFEDIAPARLEELAKAVAEIPLKKGETLFRTGDDTKGIYLIRSGKVEISKVTADGWKQTLAVLGARHFFGELSIMEKRRHDSTAEAVEDSRLMLLSKGDFEKLEKDNVDLALSIIKKIAIVMSKNLRRMNDRFLQALINY